MDDPKPRTETVSSLLAVEDTAFLLRDEMRAIRFALEYAKAELLLRDWGIRSTVIVFGSSRIPSPEEAQRAAAAATGADQLRTALQQTRKAPRAPIVLFGEAYWRRVVSFEALAAEGMISPGDLKLIEYADTADQGWESLVRRGLGASHR
jgi:predicted Rossmann-fold nucleotide-binding protein